MMQHERLDYLLKQRAAGVITLGEQRELSELLKQNQEDKYVSDVFDELLNNPIQYIIEAEEVENGLAALHKKRKQRPVQLRQAGNWRKWIAAAAVFGMLAGAGYFILKKERIKSGSAQSENVIATKKGSKTDLILPDGTKVWLNAASKLVYHQDYGAINRDVYLEGEAFFDVVKDEGKPFIVHTQTLDIKVLGTVFNVKAYEGEANTEAILIKGSVEVQVKKGNQKKVMLSPHEKVVVKNKRSENNMADAAQPEIQLFDVLADDKNLATAETLWTKNKIVFDNKTLVEIIPQLERWYDVTINLKKSNDTRLYNGTFENDKLEDVLAALQVVGKFRYAINKNNVVIY